MQVKVLSRAEVEQGAAEGVDAIISIRSAARADEPVLSVALAQATKGESARLLTLSFDDIGMANYGHFVGPTMAQITDAIAFGRQIADGAGLFDGPTARPPVIAVHCEHGKSRSASIALALLADHFGDGAEQEAVNSLLRADIEGRMHPNPLVIDLADACLFRYGRIDAALTQSSQRYARWRQLWRDIQADPQAYWDKTRRALATRSDDR